MHVFKSLGVLSFLLLSLSVSPVKAQYYEVGLTSGAIGYYGDISMPRTNISQYHPAAGLFVKGTYGSFVSLRFGFMIGSISGDDKLSDDVTHVKRNLNFKSEIQEANLMLELNIPGFYPCRGKNFSPYITAGIAYFHFNPVTSYQGELIKLQPLGTEGQGVPGLNRSKYDLIQMSIPVGLGVKYAINDKLVFGLEFVVRKTNTDYLDDVSTTYVNTDLLAASNGQAAADLSYKGVKKIDPVILNNMTRGNPAIKDYYYMAAFNLSYIFKSNCNGTEYKGRIYVGRSLCPKF